MFPTTMPTPRRPDPMHAPPLRWGVLGTGWIAERFTDALHRHTRQRVVAVGSRTATSATAFAERTGIATGHGSYADLVADPRVDVVYVATPHNHHHPHALLALNAGKHVLVEKPLALDAEQAREIADRASTLGLFCAEALWTLFLPRYDVIRQLLHDGVLGEVRTLLANNGEWLPTTHRIHRRDLAGGPLLDLGTYPVALAHWVLGPSDEVLAMGQDIPGGEVNGQTSALLRHNGGAQTTINTTIMADTPTDAVLAGTHATLLIEGPFYTPGNLTLTGTGTGSGTGTGQTVHWTEPAIAHQALYVSAVEAANCIKTGQIETPLRPLTDSVATLRIIDEIRRQLDITFAGTDRSSRGPYRRPE
jgi:predicted dehydrogenase